MYIHIDIIVVKFPIRTYIDYHYATQSSNETFSKHKTCHALICEGFE